jgi:hypothetical protein
VKTESAAGFEYSEGLPESPPRASRSASKRLLDDSDYILRAWAAILIVAATDWLLAGRVGFKIDGIPHAAFWITIIAAVGFFFEQTGRSRKMSDWAHYIALWLSLAITINIYSYLVATSRMQLWDLRFARMDAALGFDWLGCLSFIMRHPILRNLLEHDYNSVFGQLFVSIAYFAIIGRSDRNRQLLWAGMLSALITASLSGLLPAVGPYLKGDMPKWSAVLVTLRDGSLSRFALLNMTGIVTFPSFHTALAILLVYVHRPPLRSFVPVLILNVVMLVAIPFAGHHYLVDMIAGAGVAAISIAVVRLAMRPGLSEDSLSADAATNSGVRI